METILDMTKLFLSTVFNCLVTTDVAWYNIVFFCSWRVTAFAYLFGKVAPVTAVMDAMYL